MMSAGFEYEIEINNRRQICHSIEGKPMFAENGDFLGYKGTTIVSSVNEIGPATNDDKALDSRPAGSGRSHTRRRKTAAS